MRNRFFKRILSALMTLLLLIGMAGSVFPASAATGQLYFVGTNSGVSGNNVVFKSAQTYTSCYSGSKLIVSAGEKPAEFREGNATGTTIYCIEPGQRLSTDWNCSYVSSTDITKENLKGFTKTKAGQQKLRAVAAAISIAENAESIAAFPHLNANGTNYNGQGVTQVIIWEFVLGYRDAYTGKVVTSACGGKSTTPLRSNLTISNSTWDFGAYYDHMVTLLQKFLTTPTGMAKLEKDAKTYKWTWNASKSRYEVVLPKDTVNGGLKVVNSLTYKLGNTTISYEKVGDNQVRLYSKTPVTGTVKADLNYGVPTTQNISGVIWNPDAAGRQQAFSSNAKPDPHNGYFALADGTIDITLTKKDTAGNLMAGVVFGIYSDSACKTEKATMTTNASGVATSQPLPTGTYYVKEKSLPSGNTTHALNTTVYTVNATTGGTTYKVGGGTVTNSLKGTLSLTKADEVKRLDGVTFGVYNTSACTIGTEVDTLVTDANGYAQSKPLDAGTYYVKELSLPDKYKDTHEMSTKVYTVTVVNDQDTPANDGDPILNHLKGGLEVKKADELGNPIEGIPFGVYQPAFQWGLDHENDPLVEWGNSSASDGFQFTYSINGELGVPIYVREGTTAYNGWIDMAYTDPIWVDDPHTGEKVKMYRLYLGGVFPVEVSYVVPTDQASEALHFLQGYCDFIGYVDYDNLIEVARITTNSNGIAAIDGLDPDTYYVQEQLTDAQKKLYWEDDTIYKVVVTEGETTEVNNGDPVVNNAKIRIKVNKKDDLQTPLTDVVFGIYSNSACTSAYLLERLTTDAKGEAVSSALEPGKTYWIKEIQLPAALAETHAMLSGAKSVYAQLGSDGETVTYTFDFTNPHKGDLELSRKVDDAGNLLADVKFGVYKTSACTIGTEVTTLVTDSNGHAKSKPLDAGTYYVKEIELPEDLRDTHVMSAKVYTVVVQNGKTTYINSGQDVVNPRVADLDLVKIGGDGARLDGVTFGVYTSSACTIASLVETLVTDEEGYAKSGALMAGTTYYVKELELPEQYKADYIKLDTVYAVTLVYGETQRVNYDFIVNPTPGEIALTKTDDLDTAIENAVFGVFTDEACTNKVCEIVTDANGFGQSGPLDEGRYYVKELKLPEVLRDTLLVDPRVWPVDVVPGEITLVTNQPYDPDDPKSANAPFIDPHIGSLTVKKENHQGDPLSGTTYLLELSRDDGQTWAPITSEWCSSEGLKNGCLVTGEDGIVKFEDLWAAPDFRYRLTEVKAPDGYALLTEPIFEGTLPVTTDTGTQDGNGDPILHYDWELSFTAINGITPVLPLTGGSGFAMTALGIAIAGILLAAFWIMRRQRSSINKQKGAKYMKLAKRMIGVLAAGAAVFSMGMTAFAAPVNEATIDTTKTASLTVYKYDITAAEKDGVWDDEAYVSTGVYDANVNNTLGSANAPKALPNGDTSYGYSVKGVEFTYLKVADIATYSHDSKIATLYGFEASGTGETMLDALGLSFEDRVKDADKVVDGKQMYYFASDSLIDGLSSAITHNATTVKNALEAYVSKNGGTKMTQTDSYGKTSAADLPLGLYLLVETKVPEYITTPTIPFFVSLPMTSINGTNATDGGTRWMYDVTVYPKNESGMPTLEKTVRESKSDTGKHNGSTNDITDGYAHTATASDGDVVDYQVISTLPAITSTASYLTTYTYVDTLSKGITYNRNDVVIEFFKDAACKDRISTWKQTDATRKFSVTYGNNGASTMTVAMTDAGLKEINSVKTVHTADTAVESGYSNCTMRITYAATVNSDATVVYGDAGNPNDVVLTWKRTSTTYFDTLKDDCHVFTYGIDLTKVFSDGKGDFSKVSMKVHNDTDNYYVTAKLIDGVYYVTGHMAAEEDGTVFVPTNTGKLIIKGLEDDLYTVTETTTSNGYSLLKDSIKIKLSVKESTNLCDVCGKASLTASATINGDAAPMSGDSSSVNALVPLTVTNNRIPLVPLTGEAGMMALVIGGVMAAAISTMVLVLVVKKKKQEENN